MCTYVTVIQWPVPYYCESYTSSINRTLSKKGEILKAFLYSTPQITPLRGHAVCSFRISNPYKSIHSHCAAQCVNDQPEFLACEGIKARIASLRGRLSPGQ